MADVFNNMEFIARISSLAKNKGISVNKALSDCGFKDLIANIRKGSVPSVDKVILIANYFDVDMGWLLTGVGQQNSKTDASPDIGQPNSKTDTSPPPGGSNETMDDDEKLLLQNYRDLDEKAKNEIQGQAARMAVKAGNKKLLTSPTTAADSEIGNELGMIG